jgi:hypothetical protein
MLVRHHLSNALEQPSKVRGRPFQPGNPGRPPGSKNKTTHFVEQLLHNDAEKLTRKLVELALAGDVRCLLYCEDRLLPRRSGRSLDIQLPAINNVNDVPPAMAAIASGLNDGRVTAEEASHVVYLLQSYERAFMITDLKVRLEKLESQMKEKMS